MRIHVAIATTGRPTIVRQVVERLLLQSRPSDGILVVGARPEDIAEIVPASGQPITAIIAEKGLCKQRNEALRRLRGTSDVVIFFDDDFVPRHDFIEQVERMMAENDQLVGLTGHLVGDGAQTTPITWDDAVRRLDIDNERPSEQTEYCQSLYGCNMAFRLSACEDLWFDETLPLYGWQEDVDFTHRLSWRGTMLRARELSGIHLGTRSGRTSGTRLGYSQVANIVYLWRKGTMRPGLGERLLFQNLSSNLFRSLYPEPEIDRRGRLKGNIMALIDLVRGNLDPRKVERI